MSRKPRTAERAGRHQQAAVSELPVVAKCTVTQPRSSADTLRKTQGVGSPVNQERLEGRRRFGRMLASAWVVKPQRNAEVRTEVSDGESRGLRWARGTARGLWAGRPLQPVCGHSMPTLTLLAPNTPWLPLLQAFVRRALECLILSACCLLREVLPDELHPKRGIPLPALDPTWAAMSPTSL